MVLNQITECNSGTSSDSSILSVSSLFTSPSISLGKLVFTTPALLCSIVSTDNMGALNMTYNKFIKERTKHVDSFYHVVRDMVKKEELIVELLTIEFIDLDM